MKHSRASLGRTGSKGLCIEYDELLGSADGGIAGAAPAIVRVAHNSKLLVDGRGFELGLRSAAGATI